MFDVVIINHLISNCHADCKLVNRLGKLKTLCKNENLMVSMFYDTTLPIKMMMQIKDAGITVGEYKAYILGDDVQELHESTISDEDIYDTVPYICISISSLYRRVTV